MGSSGSGRISDYPGSSNDSTGNKGGGSGGPEDRCARAFSAKLEDVEHSDYWKNHGNVPRLGTQLKIEHRKRMVVLTNAGEVVGNLPTNLNYLAACMKDGWAYTGTVLVSSRGPPVATVSADFAATAP
jgi:hypothetical protein